MKWSPKVGKVFGIDVYIHFAFLLLLFLGFSAWSSILRISAATIDIAFIVSCLGAQSCELGQAFIARS